MIIFNIGKIDVLNWKNKFNKKIKKLINCNKNRIKVL